MPQARRSPSLLAPRSRPLANPIAQIYTYSLLSDAELNDEASCHACLICHIAGHAAEPVGRALGMSI